MVTFGERLKELRQNKQLTGQEVATVLGGSVVYIYKL